MRVGTRGAAVRRQFRASQEEALLRKLEGVVLLASGHDKRCKNLYKQ